MSDSPAVTSEVASAFADPAESCRSVTTDSTLRMPTAMNMHSMTRAVT
jgi:hypothetical protein